VLPNLKEWLPQDHLAWFVLDAVDESDLWTFTHATATTDGAPAFDPKMIVALGPMPTASEDGRHRHRDGSSVAATKTCVSRHRRQLDLGPRRNRILPSVAGLSAQ